MKILTETRARKLGYALSRGAYAGTSDNLIDRWYIDRIDSNVVDRRGGGFYTKKEALEALTHHLDSSPNA